MRKLEERNVCISNAKQRWNFLKRTTLAASKFSKGQDHVEPLDLPPKIVSHFQDGEEGSDGDLSSVITTATETDCTISPTISHQHLALSRQASKTSLLSMKLTLPNRLVCMYLCMHFNTIIIGFLSFCYFKISVVLDRPAVAASAALDILTNPVVTVKEKIIMYNHSHIT